jgi:hypothetical protein
MLNDRQLSAISAPKAAIPLSADTVEKLGRCRLRPSR